MEAKVILITLILLYCRKLYCVVSDPTSSSTVVLCTPYRCCDEFAKVLVNTRYNQVDRDGLLATRLCTHKSDADTVNRAQLDKLPGQLSSSFTDDH